jgi:predicted nucleic acid-binding protein
MIKVFIDHSGWYALINANHQYHYQAKEYFRQLLDAHTRLYSSVEQINVAISQIKKECGLDLAHEFSHLIEDAVLSTNLRLSWPSRRLRRNSLKLFFSIKETMVNIHHCYIFEEVKKKKINIIFSFDDALKSFAIPLMPQT